MSDTQIILKPEGYYHVYNRAVGSELSTRQVAKHLLGVKGRRTC